MSNSGANFESLLPESVVKSTSVGYPPSTIFLDTTPEFYGAKGDGATNDTLAFQECSKAVVAAGGGFVRLSAKIYIVDGLKLEAGVKWFGRSSKAASTILKALSGSSNVGHS